MDHLKLMMSLSLLYVYLLFAVLGVSAHNVVFENVESLRILPSLATLISEDKLRDAHYTKAAPTLDEIDESSLQTGPLSWFTRLWSNGASIILQSEAEDNEYLEDDSNDDSLIIRNGTVFLEFFYGSDCEGEVTYSSGLLSDVCIPSSEYVRPLFGDDNYYYFNRQFSSFMITGLTDTCDDWQIIYYEDDACSEVFKMETTVDFTACKSTSFLDLSNMLSSSGGCSFSDELPIYSDSFVLSDYAGSNDCASQPISYTAYALDSCFGYGNDSSTQYSCNSTTGTITQVQYYDRTNCTLTGYEYGHSTQFIPDQCSKVKTPGIDDLTDDVLQVTQFIGMECVLAAATSDVEFDAKQVIKSISYSTYNSDKKLYADTLKESIADCMTGVSTTDIVSLDVSGDSRRLASAPIILVQETAKENDDDGDSDDSITAKYTVKISDSSVSFAQLSTQLNAAITSGQFDSYLHQNAAVSGATGFEGATSTKVTISDATDGDDDDKSGSSSHKKSGNNDDDDDGLSDEEIAGISIACVTVVMIAAIAAYFFFCRSGAAASSTSMAAEAHATELPSATSGSQSAATTNPLQNA